MERRPGPSWARTGLAPEALRNPSQKTSMAKRRRVDRRPRSLLRTSPKKTGTPWKARPDPRAEVEARSWADASFLSAGWVLKSNCLSSWIRSLRTSMVVFRPSPANCISSAARRKAPRMSVWAPGFRTVAALVSSRDRRRFEAARRRSWSYASRRSARVRRRMRPCDNDFKHCDSAGRGFQPWPSGLSTKRPPVGPRNVCRKYRYTFSAIGYVR